MNKSERLLDQYNIRSLNQYLNIIEILENSIKANSKNTGNKYIDKKEALIEEAKDIKTYLENKINNLSKVYNENKNDYKDIYENEEIIDKTLESLKVQYNQLVESYSDINQKINLPVVNYSIHNTRKKIKELKSAMDDVIETSIEKMPVDERLHAYINVLNKVTGDKYKCKVVSPVDNNNIKYFLIVDNHVSYNSLRAFNLENCRDTVSLNLTNKNDYRHMYVLASSDNITELKSKVSKISKSMLTNICVNRKIIPNSPTRIMLDEIFAKYIASLERPKDSFLNAFAEYKENQKAKKLKSEKVTKKTTKPTNPTAGGEGK